MISISWGGTRSRTTSFLWSTTPSLWRKLLFLHLVGMSTCIRTEPQYLNKDTAASLVICGPSGVGKGTIINKFLTEMGGSKYFGFSCSHTTRNPRQGEVDGVHYHFTTVEKMERYIANNQMNEIFLEWAKVHGNYYGTSFASIQDVKKSGKICLLDIDVQGVQKIRQNFPNFWAHYLFIAPPSKEVLKERLSHRGTETAESLNRRLMNAADELDYGLTPGNFDHIIVNNNLDDACKDLRAIINSIYCNVNI
jgi:guanylate kinase